MVLLLLDDDEDVDDEDDREDEEDGADDFSSSTDDDEDDDEDDGAGAAAAFGSTCKLACRRAIRCTWKFFSNANGMQTADTVRQTERHSCILSSTSCNDIECGAACRKQKHKKARTTNYLQKEDEHQAKAMSKYVPSLVLLSCDRACCTAKVSKSSVTADRAPRDAAAVEVDDDCNSSSSAATVSNIESPNGHD